MIFSKLKSVKVIIWDLDGTLHVSREAATVMRNIFIQIITLGRNIPFKEAEKIFLNKTNKRNWSEATALITGKDEWEVLMNFEKRMQRKPFVKKQHETIYLLEKLNKFRHVVLTNATHKNAVSTLKLMGFSKIDRKRGSPFERIFAIDNTFSYKPRLTMFKQVLDYTKLHPQEHLMVGDSPEKDILPAKKLNFKTCIIGDQYPLADFSLDSIHELPSLFSLRYRLNRLLKR